MTDAPTLTGRDIGLAERATRAVLDTLLAQNATTFEQWVVLNLAGGDGGSVARNTLVQRIAFALKIDEPAASAAVDQVVYAGFATTSGGQFVLTPTRTARFERVGDASAAVTERLYGDLPIDELATARRVLSIITERANSELIRSKPAADAGG